MSVQRYVTPSGRVRYRARIKAHGREVATRVCDAVAWEQDQLRGLRIGEWIDPRRGRVPLEQVAVDWLQSRGTVKRRSQESDEASWRLYIQPAFGDRPVASITKAAIANWLGTLVTAGASASSVNRYLATLRSLLGFAVTAGRITTNPPRASSCPAGPTPAARASSSPSKSSAH